MRTICKILGFGLIAYVCFEILLNIKVDIEKQAYWKGRNDGAIKCKMAHAECLADLMDEQMKRDIAHAERKNK